MREWEQKYGQHKHRAGRRGIPFELTFKQWLKIWQDSGHLHERGHRQGQYVMARFFGRGSYKIGNVRIIPTEDNTHLISAEARARRVRNSRVTRQAHRASEIKDDQHWQFGLRVIPPKDAIATEVAQTPQILWGGSNRTWNYAIEVAG
jgi:hypothetical protein